VRIYFAVIDWRAAATSSCTTWLLRIGRNQQQYQQEQEQERRRQQLQHALEALSASNSEIKSLQNKARKSAEFQFRRSSPTPYLAAMSKRDSPQIIDLEQVVMELAATLQK
jgi:hypothetical protein